MKITEMLVTGYDGDRPVFVVNVFPDTAKALLVTADADGQDAVETAAERTTQMFLPMKRLLEGVVVVSP
jgi:hypothetical protein